MIHFFFENIEEVNFPTDTISWLKNIILTEEKKLGTLNYIFCDDEHLLKVNRDFLDHDYYTDIITFDYVKGNTISGDIFVSLPRISENTVTLQKDYDSELLRVLAHGILHLCGYKDKSAQENTEMRAKEDFYLNIYFNVSRETS
ncbi:rRNA maturation RNase YbeY [Chryseobacterium sp. 6424]|uniref:rRNA maturation RNase YbeY n=1 Tax=Chryseobacterium sp. 6424 TaxID=2039166 RepID=UPI000EFADCC7|nr:rRNA maturation RNase YbeY [Chryseobacterium sp. 6424]AYO58758.1 rRNA maturation RNase YbeY [Chryseobacterium sp. 6424]